MINEEARRILKEEKARYEYNLNDSPSAEYIGQAAKGIFESRIKALTYAIQAIEEISHLVNRPCEACEFHGENGCCKWECVFKGV